MNHIKNIIQHRSPWQKVFLFVSLLLLANGAMASLSVRGLWILTIGSSIELMNPGLHLMSYVAASILLVFSFSNDRANRIMIAFLVMILRITKILVSSLFSGIFSGSDRKCANDGYTVIENRTARHIDEGLPSDYQIRNR